MSGYGNHAGKRSEVRIIGGRWRGRKLAFTPSDGLRPTGDRIRETLFNWLTPHINGAHCADLFAGSGALGLEALSRGAGHCDFVDSAHSVVARVREHLTMLEALDRSCCYPASAQQFLAQASAPYDIVFIDPPFKLQLAGPVCTALAQRGLLRENALVYVETPASEPLLEPPPDWMLHREKRVGGVSFRLFKVCGARDSP